MNECFYNLGARASNFISLKLRALLFKITASLVNAVLKFQTFKILTYLSSMYVIFCPSLDCLVIYDLRILTNVYYAANILRCAYANCANAN